MNLKLISSKNVVWRTCAALLVLSIFASTSVDVGFAAPQIDVTVNSTKVIGVNNFSLGFALGGDDIRIWRDSSTLRELARDSNFKLVRFFEHRLGKPCTRWYESTKTGTWNWKDIDLLIQRIFEIGAEPLIVLGFYSWTYERLTSAPDGMSTDPETGLPYPDQWGAYCAEWVRHFKEAGLPVRYYEIIGEPHHYFGWPATQPKLSYYMALYNAAARAMRKVNPKVQIGCDNSIMKNVLDYFILYGENLDFLSYHTYGTGSLDARDSEILQAAETKFIGETKNVYGVEKARQIYKAAKGIDLPVFNTENNVNYYYSQGTDPRIQKMLGAVYNALVFRTAMLNGYAYNVYYHFASSASKEQINPSGGAGFGMVNLDNNQPWYPYYVHKMLGSNLAVGDKLVETSSSSDDLRAVAWIHGEKLNIFLICKVNEPRRVYLHGPSGQLDFLKIDNAISWKTPSIQTGKINSMDPLTMNGYTVMLLQTNILTPPTTYIFEDGFESGDFSMWTRTSISSGETATVRDFRPHHGTFHGRFTSNGGNALEYAYCYKAVDKNEVYARGYFQVANGLPLIDNGDRFYFLSLIADGQSVAGAGIRRNGGVDSWIIYARDGSKWVGPVYATSPRIEEDCWYCIELHWKRHMSQGLVELYVDGVKILHITNIDTNYFGNVKAVNFGLISATNVQNSLIVYGDCFILSDTYIGPET